MSGYVHCLSPVKGANENNKKKYFDFAIQTEQSVLRGICFSPEKKREIDNFIKTKSPIKIKKYGENDKFGATSLSMSTPLPFGPTDMEGDKTVVSLRNVCPNQTVTLRGKLTKLYGLKKLPSCNLTKQEGLVTDSTGSIKVVFWESFVDMAQEGKSYDFKNFTYKNDNYGIYISTAKEGSLH